MNYNQELQNYTYGVYARKSSESEDKQVQSIDRQIDDFLELQIREDLTFYEQVIKESKSAFSLGREGFSKLVELTQKGKINAWLCWHANRLSRNPIDAGIIIHLMDLGLLHHIKTPTRIYFNTPTDKMMLQIEFTMSKKDSDDKSVFVKSGLKKRYSKGLPNGKAPIGFLNNVAREKGDRDWVVDTERFDKLTLLFSRFLKGKDSLNTITEYARDVLMLTSARTKRQGGVLVCRSLVAHILKNPIYAGFFNSKNEFGDHRTLRKLESSIPRIITEDQHVHILNIFGERCRTKMQSHLTPYSGFIKGAEGNYVGADIKLQLICDCLHKFSYRRKECCPSCGIKIIEMRNPKYLTYTYYYNVKRKKTKGLSAKSIEERKIDRLLINLFEKEFNISQEFFDWMKSHLKELKEQELEEDKKKAIIEKKELKLLESKKQKLRGLFIEEIISKEEFQSDIKKLEELVRLKKKDCEYAENWYESMDELLDTIFNFSTIIKNADHYEKKQALEILSPNLVWNEKNLNVLRPKWMNVFIEGRKEVLSKYPQFEPEKSVDFKGLNSVLNIKCPTLLQLLDKVRRLRHK